MNLPGEIRNRIWRLALPDQTVATKKNAWIDLPAVSIVCKQVLRETLGLFLAESGTEIRIRDWDGAFSITTKLSYARSRRLAALIGQKVQGATPTFEIQGPPNWDNLMAWAKAEHFWVQRIDGKRSLFDVRDGHPDAVVSATLFNTIAVLSHMEWVDVEPVLEGLHEMAKQVNPRWA